MLFRSPRRDEATYDGSWAPRRHLQEGYDTEAPPPPDPRIRVSPGATKWVMRAATTPSRREQASASPVRPKIEQVFTPTNNHHHRTPHPGDHAAHTTMATGQHLAAGSAHEHRGTTTRAAAPTSKTRTPPHSRPTATPTKDVGGKDPPFAPLGCPQRLHRLVLLSGARRGRSCCRA